MKIWKFVKRLAAVTLLGGSGLGALLAIAALTPRQWGTLPTSGDCRYTVYVSGGAMHTNLIVPVRNEMFDWGKSLELQTLGKNAAQFQYLQFGWGDRIFYVETPSWDQVKPTSALRALVLQNPAAMFVKGHSTVPRYPAEELKCVRLGQADYLALMQYIRGSFQQDSQGNFQRIGTGQDGESGFYAAIGSYSMLRTCNTWTADALRSANVNTPLWSALSPAVMRHTGNGCPCEVPPP